jgi:aspartyl/asparaginyl-tRNA synthetase
MRAPANLAIFKIQGGVGHFFRKYLYKNDFTEIHSPKLIGTASEGGADIFEVKYFDTYAYLAQSPQLFKQMAVKKI